MNLYQFIRLSILLCQNESPADMEEEEFAKFMTTSINIDGL